MRLIAGLMLVSVLAAQTRTQVDFPTQIKRSPIVSDAGAAGTTLAQYCTTAGSGTLAITQAWTGLTTQTIACNLQSAGGTLQPASGQTVTITLAASPSAPQQICDVSAGGNCVIKTPNSGVYPEYWGAKAGTNSTAAFQAALNNVSGTTNAMRLVLPGNNLNCYLISATLAYTGNVSGGTLVIDGTVSGSSGEGSCLQWSGSAGGTLMTVTNATRLRISHVNFVGGALAKILLNVVNTIGAQSANIILADDSFGAMTGSGSAALQLADPGCSGQDVANLAIRDSFFAGNSSGLDTGILYNCGGNSRDLTIYDSSFEGLGWGIQYIGPGWLNLIGDFWGNNTIGDISATVGNVNVVGGGSEGSALMLKAGSGGNPMTVNISGYYFSSNAVPASNPFNAFCGGPAGDVVICASSVNLLIEDSQFRNSRTGSSVPYVVDAGFDTARPITGLRSFGNWYTNAVTDAPLWQESQSIASYIAGTGWNQMSFESLGDRGGPVPGAIGSGTPMNNYSPFMPRVYTPGSSSANCTPPQVAYSSTYIYVCTATNTWVRGAVATW